MLILNKYDIQKMDQTTIQDAVEKAYAMMSNKNYNMPDRMHISDHKNMLLLMPCFSDQYFATKLVTVFPEAVKYGQPSVNGVVVLSDNVTGQPLAIMDGAAVTAQRTGAVGGVGIKLLTPEWIKTAGILGAGVQGFSQARYLLFNRKIQTLYIYDLNLEMARQMSIRLQQEFPRVDYVISGHPEELVENSKVVIAATTSSTPLFASTPDLIRGKTFISIGSFRPDMQEFPDTVIQTADDVFVDTLFAIKESGDIAVPLSNNAITKDKIKEFFRLVEKNTYSENKTIFFKSVGMALFDLTVSSAIYQKASEIKIGHILEF